MQNMKSIETVSEPGDEDSTSDGYDRDSSSSSFESDTESDSSQQRDKKIGSIKSKESEDFQSFELGRNTKKNEMAPSHENLLHTKEER